LRYEQLLDKEKREEENFLEFLKTDSSNKGAVFPADTRFKKLKHPVATKVNSERPWSQIPLFGSLLVSIFPGRKQDFEKIHGFDLRDLRRLIDYCKDTGRVQFILAAGQTQFKGMEFLDELFTEIDPPPSFIRPIDTIIDSTSFMKYRDEYETAARTVFVPWMAKSYRDKGAPDYGATQFGKHLNTYAGLKALGYNDAADDIVGSMAVDTRRAYNLMQFYWQFVVCPVLQTLPTISSCSLRTFTRYSDIAGSLRPEAKNEVLAHEIGAFLTKKLVPVAESFESCRELVSRYESNQMYKLLEDLNEATHKSDPNAIFSTCSELEEVLSNVWNDAQTLNNRIRNVTFGMNVAFSAIGPVIGYLLGGLPGTAAGGVAAAMGFKLLDKESERFSDNLSRRIMESTYRNYVCTIAEFRAEHPIN